MLNKGKEQNVSEGSIALQSDGDIKMTINNGLTYSEIREIALDVFRSNFYELAGLAKETARIRAEEITEEFLQKLQKENPNGLIKSQDPDFQYALFEVQREYAKHGDKDLGNLLVDLLVDRSKHGQRDILQIVLNESLTTAPKLAENHLAALAVIFLLRYTQNNALINHERLGDYLDQNVKRFIKKLTKNTVCYQHLEFSGSGSIGMGSVMLEGIFGQAYCGLFFKGITPQEISERNLSIGLDSEIFIPCLNDTSKFQIRAISKKKLRELLATTAVPIGDYDQIEALYDLGRMDRSEIRNKCIEIRPYMADLFEIWTESPMQNFSLTSVGIAIGHANIKRLVGEFSDLSIWIK